MYKIGKFLLMHKKIQLGFSSDIEMPQLGSTRLGSAQEISARTHHYSNQYANKTENTIQYKKNMQDFSRHVE